LVNDFRQSKYKFIFFKNKIVKINYIDDIILAQKR